MDVFLSGMMCNPTLATVVVGRALSGPVVKMPGLALLQGRSASVLMAHAGAQAAGIVVALSPVEVARLDYFMAVFGQRRVAVAAVMVHVGLGKEPWQAADWQRNWADTVVAVAQDVMVFMGHMPPAEVAARLSAILVRGASRVRAESAPTAVRWRAESKDVRVAEQRLPYARFFAIEEYDVSWRRFYGGMSDVVTRAAFVSGDAVTVLPYDPVRDLVLVVEQFRVGPLARGDAQAWQIEAIAGRIDPGETPEAAARREAVEEADLRLDRLIPVAAYYPSPGAVSEYIYSFVALVDLPDGSAGVFGAAEEAEDIRGHLISFDRLMELLLSGEIENAPLILTALWLQRERQILRR